MQDAVQVAVGEPGPTASDRMTGAELHMTREGLGLTRAELLALLNRELEKPILNVQSVSEWERGASRISERVERIVEGWVEAQSQIVLGLIEQLEQEAEVTLHIPKGGAGGFPPGYWRAVAWLVDQHVHGLRVRYADA